MVERRPTPHDTPDAKGRNTALHYIALVAIVVALVALVAVIAT